MSNPAFYNPTTGEQAPQVAIDLNSMANQQSQQQQNQQTQQQNQMQQQQQQQQQQQNPNGSLFADSPLSQYVDSPLGQMATSYGQQFIGNNRFIKGSLQNYETFRQLKYYFSVNTSYVQRKLRLVLLPIQHKSWKRRIHRQAEGERYLTARDDVNAPDLYIPSMAFVSYVLIVAFLMGEAWSFSPVVVGDQFSSSLTALLIEVLFVKAGFYFLSSSSVPLLDIVAVCGYKYVGITLAVLVGFALGKLFYYAALFLFACSMAVFVVKTFRLAAPPSASAAVGGSGSNNARNYFLLACGVLQFALFYSLGHFVDQQIPELVQKVADLGEETIGSMP